jgi:hypothetical protein
MYVPFPAAHPLRSPTATLNFTSVRQGSVDGESATGTPYVNEYMLIVHFVPPKEGGDGLPKMARVKEFTDSATAVKFFTEERAKAAKAAAAGRS